MAFSVPILHGRCLPKFSAILSHSCVRAAAGLMVAALLVALSPTRSFAQAPANEPDVSGVWTGALGSGAAKLNIILTMTKLSSGEYSAEVNSVDQGSILAVQNFTLKGNAVRFEVQSVGGIYEGTFDDSRKELKGTWTQSNVPAQPLSFERGKADSAGSKRCRGQARQNSRA